MLKAIDHIVLSVRDIEVTSRFYSETLLTPVVRFGSGRFALQVGAQKINLHQADSEFEPRASAPTGGAIDICFLTDWTVTRIEEHLDRCGVEIVLGPVERTGATGALDSIYIRDPDGNLIEISRRH